MRYLIICIIIFSSCTKREKKDYIVTDKYCSEDNLTFEIDYEDRIFKYYKESGNLSVIVYLDTIPKMKSVHTYNKEGILIKKFRSIVESYKPIGHYYEYYENGMPKTYLYFQKKKSKISYASLHLHFTSSGTIDTIAGNYVIDRKYNSSNFEWQLFFPPIPQLKADISIDEFDSTGKMLIATSELKDVSNFIIYKAKAKLNMIKVKCNFRSSYDNRNIEETHWYSFNTDYLNNSNKK